MRAVTFDMHGARSRNLIVLLAALSIGLSACVEGSIGCSSQGIDSLTEDVRVRWNIAAHELDMTTSEELPQVIDEMAAIRNEANNLEFPACAQQTHELLVASYDAALDSLRAMADGHDDDVITYHLMRAQQADEGYRSSRDALDPGQSFEQPGEQCTTESETDDISSGTELVVAHNGRGMPEVTRGDSPAVLSPERALLSDALTTITFEDVNPGSYQVTVDVLGIAASAHTVEVRADSLVTFILICQ